MGLTWSLDILSFFAPHPVWYIADTANILHGVFIFAAFVLKKKVGKIHVFLFLILKIKINPFKKKDFLKAFGVN